MAFAALASMSAFSCAEGAAASRGVLASQARVRGSRSPYYPEVEGDGSYLRLGPTASIDIPGLGAFDLFPANNYDAHVSLRQTVFDFGKRSTAVDYAQSLERTANHNVELVQTALAFQTIDTFYAIVFLERSLAVQDEEIAALTQHLSPDRIRDLFEASRDTLRAWIERLRKEAGEEFPEKVTAFRKDMAVHGRYRLPCPGCGSPIQRIRYAEHESNYCPQCQTGGKLVADRALSRLLKKDWPRTLDELEARYGRGGLHG